MFKVITFTNVNANVYEDTSYTVPSGKVFITSMFAQSEGTRDLKLGVGGIFRGISAPNSGTKGSGCIFLAGEKIQVSSPRNPSDCSICGEEIDV